MHPHPQIRPTVRTSPGAVSRPNITHGLPDSFRRAGIGAWPTQRAVLSCQEAKNPTLLRANMAEFGAAGAGRRDEDRRALKEGKKLLKKALGAAGVLKGGKHKEKLRREKERRRDEQRARAQAEAREMAARRAELHQRATAAAAELRRQADSKSHAEDRARATDALEAERAAARARAQREAETERRCQATERALDGGRNGRSKLSENSCGRRSGNSPKRSASGRGGTQIRSKRGRRQRPRGRGPSSMSRRPRGEMPPEIMKTTERDTWRQSWRG